ncbi:SDR family oxidoreductase, partial [Stenotrophomonas maltophilia]|uniref:SDR family oxidoreductase n=1 Tax=Stenotrophomonas maltophilia TaxID=40324 RepID=UPI0013DBCB64
LQARGARVRVLTGRPADARTVLETGVELVRGRFEDAEAIAAALTDVKRLFLVSPISETLVSGQSALIRAAERAGVRRVVKISGSHWT